MSFLTETIIFVFGLVAIGYIAGAVGLLKPESGDSISEFVVSVGIPAMIFKTLSGADFHGAAPWGLWTAYFGSVAVAWTVGHMVITRAFGRDARAGVVAGVAAGFSNLVLLGIPLISGIYGPGGLETISLLVSVNLPIMMAASILMLGLVGTEGKADFGLMAKSYLTQVFTNPLITAVLIGIIWRFTGLGVAPLPARFIDAFANAASPLALFAVGLSLRKFGISGNVRPGLAISVLKLGLMPAIAMLIALALGLPPLTAKVAVVAASLPSGVNSYLIAVRFNTGQALATNAMTIGVALSVATTAFWVGVAQWVFG